MREVIFGDKQQYKLLENGLFYSKVIASGRSGFILGNEWIEKNPIFQKCDKSGGGYFVVCLKYNGKSVHRLHRLVASFFVDGFKEGLSVNHIDGDRSNNNASNLEWVTHKENIANARHRGAFKNIGRFSGKLSEEAVLAIITMINSGKTNLEIANLWNLDKTVISKIRNKDQKTFTTLTHLVVNPFPKKYFPKRKFSERNRDKTGKFARVIQEIYG